MYEIKFTCPTCQLEHPWVSVNMHTSLCTPGRCDECYAPFLVVLHPELCHLSYCQMACSIYLRNCKVNKVVEFEGRERTMFTLGEIVERMFKEKEVMRIADELSKK